MRAIAAQPGQREVRMVDVAEPETTSADQVTFRILDVGVCGTDKEIAAFEYGTPPDGDDYLVMGHESLAEVVDAGGEADGLQAGDLVVPMVRRPCPHDSCPACRAGRQDFCVTGDFTERGIKQQHGYMTEVVVEHRRYLNPVSPELRDVAVLVEPLTIAEKGLQQVWEVQRRLPWVDPDTPFEEQGRGKRAVALGAGPVGLLGAMALAVRGYETFMYSRSPKPNDKADLSVSMGIPYISSKEVDAAGLVKQVGAVDVVYEGVGLPKPAFETMRALGPNAVFVLTGVPALKGAFSFELDALMRAMVLGNQVVMGTVNAGKENFEGAIRDLATFLARWPDAVRSLVTRHPMDDFEELLAGGGGGIKNVLAIA